MLKINDNLYVNQSNIVKAVQNNSEYYLILTNNVKLPITKDIYNALKGVEPND